MSTVKYLLIFLSFLITPLFSQDGTYEGSAKGKNGDIKVSVTVAKNKISDIKVLESKEDKTFVYPRMIKAILDNNNINVDTISTATYTSKGFLQAIEKALSASGKNFKGKLIQPAKK